MNHRRLLTNGALLLAAALSGSGCLGHVRLEAPPPDAPPKVRKAAYARLRPVLLSYTCSDGVTIKTSASLELADGRKVHHAEDLLAVVPPDSECARSVQDHLGLRRTGSRLYWGGYGGGWAGAALAFAGAAQMADDPSGKAWALVYTGIGISLTGFVVSMLAQFIWAPASVKKARTAFKTYDDALMQRLRLRRVIYVVEEAEAAPGVRPASGTAGD